MKVTLEGNPPFDLIVTGIDKAGPTDGSVEVTLRLSAQDVADQLSLRIWLEVEWATELRNRLDAAIPTAAAQRRQRS